MPATSRQPVAQRMTLDDDRDQRLASYSAAVNLGTCSTDHDPQAASVPGIIARPVTIRTSNFRVLRRSCVFCRDSVLALFFDKRWGRASTCRRRPGQLPWCSHPFGSLLCIGPMLQPASRASSNAIHTTGGNLVRPPLPERSSQPHSSATVPDFQERRPYRDIRGAEQGLNSTLHNRASSRLAQIQPSS